MMVSMRVRVETLIADYLIQRSALQREIRAALVDGPCRTWIDRFLPRHFEPFAAAKYGYAPRRAKWQAIKRRGSTRLGIPPQNPPRPLVWTGAANKPGSLIVAVLAAATSGDLLARAQGIARGSRIEARIKVPIPHPINPVNRGELTVWSREEKTAMDNAAIATLAARLQNYPKKVRVIEETAA